MARHSEAFRFAFLALGFAGCSALTKVDWSLIPPPDATAGTASTAGSGGVSAEGGASPVVDAGGAGEGGVPEGGSPSAGQGPGGEGGFGGELGGAPPDVGGTAGLGGTSGGGTGGGASGGGTSGGGTSGGGTGGGGTGGNGGGSGSGGSPVCDTYPTPPASVNLSGKIVVFDGGASATGGNLDGRAGADAKCLAASVQLGLSKATVHALIAVQEADALKVNLAQTFTQTFSVPPAPVVVSPMGILLGTSFDDFMITPKTTFICGGVVREDVRFWFTGVTQNGDFSDILSCRGWRLDDIDPNNLDMKGGVGRTDTTANEFRNSWRGDHPVACLNKQAHVLCVGWD